MSRSLKEKALHFYHTHEKRFHVGFFLGGFAFDVLTAGAVDEAFMLVQQVAYLILIGFILSIEHLVEAGVVTIQRSAKLWQYRSLFVHFALGTILNMYSIFFLKSASIFTSIVFVIFLLVLIIGNELPVVQKSGLNVRWALWVLCLFCFYSIIFPLLLGFVGWLPFLLAAVGTALSLYMQTRWMLKYQPDFKQLMRAFLQPGVAVILMFVILYFLGLIPPVPLAVQDMGIYHQLEKRGGKFILSHQKPWWKFWENGDQTFRFRNGDPIYFFSKIVSPGGFSDQVVIHWLYKDPKAGWMTSDKVRMQITGGREQGFRGYSTKKNYSEGKWRVQVETTDGREIGRLYLNIEPDPTSDERVWSTTEY